MDREDRVNTYPGNTARLWGEDSKDVDSHFGDLGINRVTTRKLAVAP